MNINQRIKGGTKLLGVLGYPVSHSISPQLHNTLADCLNIDAVYIPLKVEPDKLPAAVYGLRAGNFLGFNVTVPHKEAVVACCDELSEEVLLSGAANTIKHANGRLYAYNTDGTGFIRAFRLQTGQEVKNRVVTILGAGGTARSISIKLAQEGAAAIHIVNRTIDKAKVIAEAVNQNIRCIASGMGYEEAFGKQSIENSDIIINTTSLGLHPDIDGCPLPDAFPFRREQVVYDVIYKPGRTKLLQLAQRQGCMTANGLGMLICQGIAAFEIWMETTVPQELVETITREFTNYSAG